MKSHPTVCSARPQHLLLADSLLASCWKWPSMHVHSRCAKWDLEVWLEAATLLKEVHDFHLHWQADQKTMKREVLVMESKQCHEVAPTISQLHRPHVVLPSKHILCLSTESPAFAISSVVYCDLLFFPQVPGQ